MKDTLLEQKNELKRITIIKSLTRLERYKLVEEKSKELSDRELMLLIEEYNRDYESYNRLKDINNMVTVGVAGINILLLVASIYFDDYMMEFKQFVPLFINSSMAVCVIIMISTFITVYRSYSMTKTKYILDVLIREREIRLGER